MYSHLTMLGEWKMDVKHSFVTDTHMKKYDTDEAR